MRRRQRSLTKAIYDVFSDFSSVITTNGTPSPHLDWRPTEQDMFDAISDRNFDEDPKRIVEPGDTARHRAVETGRATLPRRLVIALMRCRC